MLMHPVYQYTVRCAVMLAQSTCMTPTVTTQYTWTIVHGLLQNYPATPNDWQLPTHF